MTLSERDDYLCARNYSCQPRLYHECSIQFCLKVSHLPLRFHCKEKKSAAVSGYNGLAGAKAGSRVRKIRMARMAREQAQLLRSSACGGVFAKEGGKEEK